MPLPLNCQIRWEVFSLWGMIEIWRCCAQFWAWHHSGPWGWIIWSPHHLIKFIKLPIGFNDRTLCPIYSKHCWLPNSNDLRDQIKSNPGFWLQIDIRTTISTYTSRTMPCNHQPRSLIFGLAGLCATSPLSSCLGILEQSWIIYCHSGWHCIILGFESLALWQAQTFFKSFGNIGLRRPRRLSQRGLGDLANED